jgi:hypothetical protein
LQQLHSRVDGGLAGGVAGPAVVIDQAYFAADRGEALVGVVRAEVEAVLGAAREHAVGFDRGLGDEVVDEDADVGLVAAEDEICETTSRVLRGVYSCH